MRETAFIISLVFLSILILPFVSAITITTASPENKTYNQASPLIDLNWSADNIINWAGYSLNGGANNTAIFSIDPIHLDSISGSGSPKYLNGAWDVFISGDVAYVVSRYDHALTTFNITNTSNIVHMGNISGTGSPTYLAYPHSVYVIGDVAYVCGGFAGIDNSFSTFNVSDPANIVHLDSITGAGSPNYLDGAYSVYVSGEIAYVVSVVDDALTTFNVSNASNIVHMGNISGTGSPNYLNSPNTVIVSGEIAYITSGLDDALTTFNVSNASNIVHMGNISGAGSPNYLNNPRSVYLSGEIAHVVSADNNALTTFNVSNASSITHLGNISGSGSPNYLDSAWDVVVSNNIAYVVSAMNNNALTTFDVSNASNIIHLGNISGAGSPNYLYDAYGIYVSGNVAYVVASMDDSFSTFDITREVNTSITATEGSNNITIWGNKTNGTMNYTTVYFTYYDYGNITAETPDGDQDWNYSQVAGTDELFNLTISSNGTSNSSVNFTIWGEGVNFTMNATNVSVNSTGNATVEVNISSNVSLTAGTYSLNLSYNQTETGNTKNISITAYISGSSGDVDIVETSWAIAKATTDIITRTFTIENKGTYNLSSCNMSFTNTLSATATFNHSNFNVSTTINKSVLMTVSGGSAGTDNSARVNIVCVATATGGTDSDQVTGSISISAVTGGGGGGQPPQPPTGNFDVYPSQRIVGVGFPEYLIQPPFVVNVYNGNISQKFYLTFSSEVNPYCELLEYPEETISPNGYCKFVFECYAPDGTVEGHVHIKSVGGSERAIPMTLIGGTGLWEQFNAFFIMLLNNPIQAVMMNFIFLGWQIPVWAIGIVIVVAVVIFLKREEIA